MWRIAVVGGGPGGLMTARLLEDQAGDSCRVTLFEASARLGGKAHTRRFRAARVPYESGIAECYDYEAFGRDPLKDLVRGLGLTPIATHGTAVALDGVILRDDRDVERHCGTRTLAVIRDFRAHATRLLPPERWHAGFSVADNGHPWARRTCQEILDELPDLAARRYLRVTMHADLATEPSLVNGLVGLRNVLKSVPGYGAQYTIAGGMGMLPRRLALSLLRTDVRLDARVVGVSQGADERFTVTSRRGRRYVGDEFDAVVVALPHGLLPAIDWAGSRLQQAMVTHVAHYDHPAHYLRLSMLFDQPFWRGHFSGSWLMLDAFGGCCLYDESGPGPTARPGVLGCLVAGAEALALDNLNDWSISARVLESLPDALRSEAGMRLREARVHRWTRSLSGTPGGFPLRDARSAHRPEPSAHRRLAVVGDYLFDSTLNGVLRSAGIAAEIALEGACRRSRRCAVPPMPAGEPHTQHRNPIWTS